MSSITDNYVGGCPICGGFGWHQWWCEKVKTTETTVSGTYTWTSCMFDKAQMDRIEKKLDRFLAEPDTVASIMRWLGERGVDVMVRFDTLRDKHCFTVTANGIRVTDTDDVEECLMDMYCKYLEKFGG